MARKISVEIVGDASSLQRAFSKAESSSSKLGHALGGVMKVGLAAAGTGLLGLGAAAKIGFDEFEGAAKIQAQTAAALKSTSGAANVTQAHIEDLAGSLLNLSGVDDEAIQGAENMLLTFTNVRNEVGKGNDIFDQASKTILDMDEAMTQGNSTSESLKNTSILLGKALNDPVLGSTALRRVGVALTEQQQKQIKAFVKSGDTMKAQKLILRELSKEFGGSARAIGDTLPGKLSKLRESFNNLAGELFGSVAPALTDAANKAVDFVQKVADAKGMRAKLNIVWTGIEAAGKTLTQKIGAAIRSVDWAAAWTKAQGIGDALAARLEAVNWTAVGAAIIAGVSAALTVTGQVSAQITAVMGDALTHVNWEAVGTKAGPGLAAAVLGAIAALGDPGFWARHWQEIASALLLAVPVDALAAKLGLKFIRIFTKPLADVAKFVIRWVVDLSARFLGELGRTLFPGLAREAERIGPTILSAIKSLPREVAEIIRNMASLAGRDLGVMARELGGIAKRIGKAIVDGVRELLSHLPAGVRERFQAVGQFIVGWARTAYAYAFKIGSAIVQGIVGGLGGLFSAAKNALSSALRGAFDAVKGIFGIHSPSTVAAQEIGKPIADGVILGWVTGSAALPSKMSEKLRSAIDAARTTVDNARGRFGDAFSGLADVAANALSAISSTKKTKSEKLLDRLVSKHDADEFAANLSTARAAADDAKKALAAFVANPNPEGSLSPDEVAAQQKDLGAAAADAQKQVDDLLYQQQQATLQKRATAERLNLDATEALKAQHFQVALAALQARLSKQGATVGDATKQVLKLLGAFGVNFKAVGADMGDAWIRGLKEAIAGAARGAGSLSDTISKAAAGIPSPKAGRAFGGPVLAGVPYTVGEFGRELFVPSQSGFVVPQGGASASALPDRITLDLGDAIIDLVRTGKARFERANGAGSF